MADWHRASAGSDETGDLGRRIGQPIKSPLELTTAYCSPLLRPRYSHFERAAMLRSIFSAIWIAGSLEDFVDQSDRDRNVLRPTPSLPLPPLASFALRKRIQP